MGLLIVNLQAEEKLKIINSIKKAQEEYISSLNTYDIEMTHLAFLKSHLPPGNENYIVQITAKINDYSLKLANIDAKKNTFIANIDAIQTGKRLKVEDIYDYLHRLYHVERQSKSIGEKYLYYPRLKKAKEDSIYAFSTKIKTIMEVKYVKFA